MRSWHCAPVDGYTLLLAAASYTANPAVYKVSFDSVKDITPIAQLAHGPFIIAVNPKLPVSNLKELVEYAKKEPSQLTYASAGNGSFTHLVTEYFLDIAGVDIVHAAYKGKRIAHRQRHGKRNGLRRTVARRRSAGGAPEEFVTLLAAEVTRRGALVRKRNIRAE